MPKIYDASDLAAFKKGDKYDIIPKSAPIYQQRFENQDQLGGLVDGVDIASLTKNDVRAGKNYLSDFIYNPGSKTNSISTLSQFMGQSPTQSDSDYNVASLYQSLLGRQGDTEGINYWNDLVKQNNWGLNELTSAFQTDLTKLGYSRSQDGLWRPKSMAEQGFSEDQFKSNAASQGWNQQQVEKLAYDARNAANIPVPPVTSQPQNPNITRPQNPPIVQPSDPNSLNPNYNTQFPNTGVADNSPGNWQDPNRPGNEQYQSINTGTNPVNRQVNPNTDTVQGQVNGLLQQNNPLMQRAYYQGLDMANSRGLLNSSMASEAAQAAMMDRALPIAQQDASTFFDQGTRNQAVQNQFNLNDRQYGQSAEQAALDRDLSREKMEQADSTLAQSTTANTQGKYLDAINQITQNSMTSINEIEVTPGMTQEDKDAMIANTVARRDADLAWVRQLYSNMPTWDFSWFNIEPGDMPSAPGIGV